MQDDSSLPNKTIPRSHAGRFIVPKQENPSFPPKTNPRSQTKRLPVPTQDKSSFLTRERKFRTTKKIARITLISTLAKWNPSRAPNPSFQTFSHRQTFSLAYIDELHPNEKPCGRHARNEISCFDFSLWKTGAIDAFVKESKFVISVLHFAPEVHLVASMVDLRDLEDLNIFFVWRRPLHS